MFQYRLEASPAQALTANYGKEHTKGAYTVHHSSLSFPDASKLFGLHV